MLSIDAKARIVDFRWGKKDSLEMKQFFQRLSVTLQRGNAAILVDRDVEPI